MATTYDKASLVMIPSGYKDDKLYSVKPTDGSGDFTFSRDGAGASPATRVNASGLIEKGRENLLVQSETFDNASWTKSNAVITANSAAAPNGTSTADTFAITANFGTILQTPTLASGVVATYSVYVKNIDAVVFNLQVRTSSTAALATFNFSGATLTSSTLTSGITQGFSDEGNGWYRCYVTFVTTETNQLCRLQIQDSGDSVYIWGAQLEQGLISTSYIETTTAAVSAGLLGDMPRLDYHNPDSPTPNSCPSLLLEPSRVNLLSQSEFYGGSDWSRTRCGVVTNTSETLSPEGLYNASKMTSTDASESYAQDNVTLATSGVFSFFAKKGDLDYCHSLVWDLAANGRRQWFNLATGEVGGTTIFGSGYDKVDAGMEDYGNGWWRCWFAWNNGNTTSAVRINISSADETIGSPVNSYGYFYGAQVESAVSYPTSYIPTYGSAASRAVDSCVKTGISSLLNTSEGTIFLEMNTPDNDSASKVFTIGDGTANRIQTFYYEDSVRLNFIAGGVTYAYFNHALTDVNDTIKVAIAYASNDIVMYVDGALANSDTGATMPSALSYARFDNGSGGANFIGNVKQSLLFKTRLTNAELAALTA